jgi:hypothetical protein
VNYVHFVYILFFVFNYAALNKMAQFVMLLAPLSLTCIWEVPGTILGCDMAILMEVNTLK